MYMMKQSARARRMAMFGHANQLSYESKERVERDALRKKVADGKGKARKPKEKGMNAGTWSQMFR